MLICVWQQVILLGGGASEFMNPWCFDFSFKFVCSLFCCFCSSLKHFTAFDLLGCSTPWWGSAASFPWKSGRLGNMSGRCPRWTASDCDTCQDQYNTEAKLMLRERAERAKLGSRAARERERRRERDISQNKRLANVGVCNLYARFCTYWRQTGIYSNTAGKHSLLHHVKSGLGMLLRSRDFIFLLYAECVIFYISEKIHESIIQVKF